MRRGSIAVGLGLAVAILLGASGAVAFWTGAGAGSSRATSATTVGVTLSAASVEHALYPGGTAAVRALASNSNAAPVRIAALALDTAQGTDGFGIDSDHATCPTSDLSFRTQDNDGDGWLVPRASGGADGSAAIDMPGALSLDSSAPDSCQGATVTIYLSSTAPVRSAPAQPTDRTAGLASARRVPLPAGVRHRVAGSRA